MHWKKLKCDISIIKHTFRDEIFPRHYENKNLSIPRVEKNSKIYLFISVFSCSKNRITKSYVRCLSFLKVLVSIICLPADRALLHRLRCTYDASQSQLLFPLQRDAVGFTISEHLVVPFHHGPSLPYRYWSSSQD